MLGTNLHSIFSFSCSNMAVQSLFGGELSESLRTSQAADHTEPSELCEHIFNSMFNRIGNCDDFNTCDNRLTLVDDYVSLILLHLIIRSLHKNFMTICVNVLARSPLNQMSFVCPNSG